MAMLSSEAEIHHRLTWKVNDKLSVSAPNTPQAERYGTVLHRLFADTLASWRDKLTSRKYNNAGHSTPNRSLPGCGFRVAWLCLTGYACVKRQAGLF